MILTRNNFHQFAKFILGVAILCLAFVATTHPTYAIERKTISSSDLKTLLSRSLSRSLQGATVTKQYYIYTDWSCDGCKTNLIRCKRSNPSSCDTLASGYYGHASTIYHEWGTNTITVVENGSQGYENHCINVNTGKTASGCKKMDPSGLGNADGGASDWLQGYTWYGDIGLRGWGYSPKTNGVNKLLLYKKGSGLYASYTLPSSIYEIEGVAVDGSTGDVIIIVKDPGAKTVKFYQISKSVLNLGGATTEKREAKTSAARKKDASDYQQENAYTPSVSTYDGTVDTNFFGTLQDDSEGCGVYTTLDLVMTILTAGIGIAAVIGIAISGIIYLTAKGDVAKTTKAKRRIYEIVIGLAVYAVIWALLTFLLPEFNPELKACKTLTPEEIAARDAEREAKRQANQQSSKSSGSSSGSSSSSSTSDYDFAKWKQAYTEQAKYMKNATYGSNYKSNFKKSKTDGTCITYVSTSLQRLGVIPKNTYVWYNCGLVGTAKNYIKQRKDVFQVTYPNKTVAQLYEKGKIQKGDIVFYQYSKCGEGHTMIFVGFNSKNKPIFNTFGHAGMKTNYAHSDGSKKVKMLIHLKKTSL